MTHEPSDQSSEAGGAAEGPDEAGPRVFSIRLWGLDGPLEEVADRSDFESCTEDEGHDDDCWGHVSPIRKPVAIPPPNLLLTRDEMRRLAMGHRPVWDDKWLAFMEDDRLFFHRCWTGHGIYEVTFAATSGGFVVTSALVEGDPRHYMSELDLIAEGDNLRALIVSVSGEPAALSSTIKFRVPLLKVVQGDITTQDVDAIVNTANASLVDGEGVNGAIHRAAGPELLRNCSTLGGCAIGRAIVTPGFELPARWIIHTVGPEWRDGVHGEPVLLESCYRESLARADEVGAETVAFPAIATGAHGCPLEVAAAIAVDTVRSISTKVRSIRFVCFDTQTWRAFQNVIG